MRKALPYIVLVIVLLIAGGIYIDWAKKPMNVSDAQSGNKELPKSSENKVAFASYGKAPELLGISGWLNSNPLKISDLKGKVVLVDFWTYSCINCIRTLPYVTKWFESYKDEGFVVIGVHTPEFAFEKVSGNVANAIKQYNIHYPVAQDNDYKTWNAYQNQYWPAEYLVDKNGDIVYEHFGEGNYDKTESAIRELLGMSGSGVTDGGEDLSTIKSPEMYFGTKRLENLISSQTPSDTVKAYTFPNSLKPNTFALNGGWQFDEEKVTLISGAGGIKLNFNASRVHIVASADKPITVTVLIDGKKTKTVTIFDSKLYTLFEGDAGGHTLELQIPEAGFEAFTFTFG